MKFMAAIFIVILPVTVVSQAPAALENTSKIRVIIFGAEAGIRRLFPMLPVAG